LAENGAEVQTAHEPVLLEAVIEALSRIEQGSYVDATFGRGGHARAMLERLGDAAKLLVLDRDPAAIAVALALAERDPRVIVRHARFSALSTIVTELGLDDVVGILIDLGVSSPQLDDAERGFSFRLDGPLDMRMDPTSGRSAADWIADASIHEMERVFREYGEERFARRIAAAIARHRAEAPIRRTRQLADIVAASQPRPDPHKHAATRVFQAIRIAVNDELGELEQALAGAFEVLIPGGRLAVISFHSLEDRIVKRTFRRLSEPTPLPRRLPVRNAPPPRARTVGKPLRASTLEIERNPRARSAVLRVVEKVA